MSHHGHSHGGGGGGGAHGHSHGSNSLADVGSRVGGSCDHCGNVKRQEVSGLVTTAGPGGSFDAAAGVLGLNKPGAAAPQDVVTEVDTDSAPLMKVLTPPPTPQSRLEGYREVDIVRAARFGWVGHMEAGSG